MSKENGRPYPKEYHGTVMTPEYEAWLAKVSKTDKQEKKKPPVFSPKKGKNV